MITVCVSVGNSDGKLTQARWAAYVSEVRRHLRRRAWETRGEWYSLPDSPWQNACFCVSMPGADVPALKTLLAGIRERYGQDPVAWLAGETEFL